MSFVALLADWLRAHGVDVLLGITLVLALFAAWVWLTRATAGKRQLAGLGLVAAAVYLALAVVPLPRLQWLAGDVSVSRAGAGVTAPSIAPFAAPSMAPPATEPMDPVATNARPLPAPGPITAAVPGSASVSSIDLDLDVATAAAWTLVVGGALVGLHLMIGWLRLRRILAASRAAPDALRVAAALPDGVRLRVSTALLQPFCCGLLRGCIVVPAPLAEPSSQSTFVVRHEAAHLRAGDTRWRALAALLRPLLFWHPLYWWLQSQLRFTGELLADDAAAAGAVGDYVRCMVTLASQPAPRVTGTMAAFVFVRRSELYRRLQMMLQRDVRLSPSTPSWRRLFHGVSAAAIVAIGAAFFGAERAVAQDPVRKERMRETIDEMRMTIAQLRTELAELRAVNQGAVGSAPSKAADPLRGANGTYRIQKGDSLHKIAKEVYGSSKRGVDKILALNPDLDPDKLRVGALIHVDDRQPARQSGGGMSPGANSVGGNPLAGAGSPSGGGSGRDVGTGGTPRRTRSIDGLAEVITRCIELRGQVRIAELQAARIQQSFDAGRTDKFDLEIAKIEADTKQRQYDAVRGLLEGEIHRAERNLEYTRKLHERGFVAESEVVSAEFDLQALHRAFK